MNKEYLVSAKEMKQLDNNTITKTGIPSLVLMERASLAVAGRVMQNLGGVTAGRILVISGNGNNGADGICTARILKEYGYQAEVCLLESSREYTDELLQQKKIADIYNVPFVRETEAGYASYSVIVDAIFGIGLNRDVEDGVRGVIDKINASGCYVISVDIPSGINASSGTVCGVAVRADETVTFGFYKCGQIFYPGREYCGKVTKAYIGINETSFYDMSPSMFTYKRNSDDKLDFGREVSGNKGTFGKVLVIAGREATTGAALLCAKSALRSGCGMVALFTETGNRDTLLKELPEVMVETYDNNDCIELRTAKLDKWLAWADVCVIGCGLGRDEIAYQLVDHTIGKFNKSIVADADALQLFAAHEELKEAVYSRSTDRNRKSVIFTPHPGELAALAHSSVSDVKKERITMAEKVCREYGAVLVAKDADTLCMSDGECTYLNCSGNDGMSTAGSGDVLAGLVGSFVAQAERRDISLYDAVCLAVYVHGLAGDYQVKRNGKSFMVASDIIEAYKYILE